MVRCNGRPDQFIGQTETGISEHQKEREEYGSTDQMTVEKLEHNSIIPEWYTIDDDNSRILQCGLHTYTNTLRELPVLRP